MCNIRENQLRYDIMMSARIIIGTVCVYVLLLSVLTGCKDRAANVTTDPFEPPEKQLAEYVEWVESEPELRQRGRLFYDEQDRLELYEFSVDTVDEWVATIRIFYSYESGRLAGRETSIRPLGTDKWQTTVEVEYSYNEQGRIKEALRREVNERTGEIGEFEYEYSYTPNGQVSEMVIPANNERKDYEYDDRGDVTKIRSFSDGNLWLESVIEYDDSWNPFYNLPPQSGFIFILYPGLLSYHNSIAIENAVPGEDPAMRGEGTNITGEDGYPTRREFTVWNMADPDIRTTIITEFVYR